MLITITSTTIDIRTGLSTSLFSLLVSIINTVTTLMIFVYYILAVILKIVFLGLPHVFKLIFIVVEFHRTQLGNNNTNTNITNTNITNTKGFYDLFIEAVIILFFVLYLLFRPRILSSWRYQYYYYYHYYYYYYHY